MQLDGSRFEALVRLIKALLGFVGVGAVNTVLSILLYEILILFLPYWLAYLIPFPVSIAFLLYANATFVFGRRVTPMSAVAFTLLYLATYAAGRSLTYNEQYELRTNAVRELKANDYRMKDMVRYIARSRIFLEK